MNSKELFPQSDYIILLEIITIDQFHYDDDDDD